MSKKNTKKSEAKTTNLVEVETPVAALPPPIVVETGTPESPERRPLDAELADLERLQAQIKAKKAEAKQAVKDDGFYGKYPWVLTGSIRDPNEADKAALKHVHGKVCTISCQNCGALRTVNKQDAFQVKFCHDCRDSVQKQQAKAKRIAKSLSPEALEAKKAKLLEELNAIESTLQ